MWRTFSYLDEHGKKIHHLQTEREEQILAETYVLSSDCVLELGARYGTVSCATNAVLSCKTDHVVVEPDARVWNALESNKIRNKMNFQIIKGFCSTQSLGLHDLDNYRGYGTRSCKVEQSDIPSFTLEALESLVSKPFNCLIADCEGYLETFLDENPTLLPRLRCIIFEKDCPKECDYNKIKQRLAELGFEQKVKLFREVWIKPVA